MNKATLLNKLNDTHSAIDNLENEELANLLKKVKLISDDFGDLIQEIEDNDISEEDLLI